VLNCDVVVKLCADDPERLRIIDLRGVSCREADIYDEASRLSRFALDRHIRHSNPITQTRLPPPATLQVCTVIKENMMRQQCSIGVLLLDAKRHLDTITQTLSSSNRLANVYRDQGEYKEAGVLYQRALAGRNQVLGPDHPDTLVSTSNFAVLYSEQSKYDETAVLHQHVFARRQKALRHDHPDTLKSANYLAIVYVGQGKYDEAAVLYQLAFGGRKKVLGPDHPDTLKSAENLAHSYRHLRKYDEAAALDRHLAAHKNPVL
jgi:tetratricopeptide (TPR) repeat protein